MQFPSQPCDVLVLWCERTAIRHHSLGGRGDEVGGRAQTRNHVHSLQKSFHFILCLTFNGGQQLHRLSVQLSRRNGSFVSRRNDSFVSREK